MREITLTKGMVAIVDDEDFDLLSRFNWCYSGTYAVGGVFGKKTYMHRFLNGTAEGLDTDHINGNKLDNRKCNLRSSSRSHNMANTVRNKNNTSGYKGVHKSRVPLAKPWIAQITKDRRNVYLGYYETPEDASRAYQSAAYELFGQFAKKKQFELKK